MMFLVFIGICVWAFSRRRRKSFDDAAHLPFDDDDDAAPAPKAPRRKNRHG